jgi:7-carboxy-7-deazaguanine synthase
MKFIDARVKFGEEVRIPRIDSNGFLLSGDGVFFSVQGEGLSLGKPAIFIRLHGCNLRCSWVKSGGSICDAWYTWKEDTKDYWTSHSFMSFADILKEIQKYPCKRIVISGGEPLLQQKQIITFINAYLDNDYIVEIETNGTIAPSEELLKSPIALCFNCSPKLSAAGMEKKDCIQPDALRLINKYKDSIFKFVVTNNEDLLEVESLVQEFKLKANKIVIMPEGINVETLTKRMQELVEVVKVRGWSLTPRLQIYIWGNKRGT